jgi:gluconokinase
MSLQTPVSDQVKTRGLVYFARMVDKIRLQAQGVLAPGYHLGVVEDPTSFDARFCRHWEIDYEQVKAATLRGLSTEAVFDEVFRGRTAPNEEQILVWNLFLLKRGWRDSGSAGLEQNKARDGFAGRDDIRTYVDLHDADEGRPLTPVF